MATRLFVPEVGAAAFRLKALVLGLSEKGAEVKVLTTTPPPGAGSFTAGFSISRWPVLRDAGGNVRGYLQYLSFDVPLFFRLLSCRADVVVAEPPPTTGLMTALTSVLRRRPFVYYAADVWSDALAATSAPKPIVALMHAVEGFTLRRAAKVIAISDGVAAAIEQFRVGPERLTVVGNGVDTDVFTLEGETSDQTDPYFVYTGTMSEWQGADVFLRAMPVVLQEYSNAQLRFFGQGSDEDRLKELARELAPDNVHFGGVVPPQQAAAWLRGAQAALVSIVPGQGYDFAKPTKIYAAAACGTGVIFAGVGDGAKIVADGGLGTVSAYEAGAVANAMLAALTNPQERRDERAQWVHENASLARSGELAAAEVLSIVR